MHVLQEWLAAFFILAGAFCVASAAFGLARLPDPFTRMHAATTAGVVGSGCMLIGAAIALGTLAAALTAAVGVVFLLATTPLASHALGRAAYVAGTELYGDTVVDELEGVLPRHDFDQAQLLPRQDGRGQSVPRG